MLMDFFYFTSCFANNIVKSNYNHIHIYGSYLPRKERCNSHFNKIYNNNYNGNLQIYNKQKK